MKEEQGKLTHEKEHTSEDTDPQRDAENDGRITQCSTKLYGVQKEMMRYVKTSQKRIEEYARRFPRGHWSFLGPGSEKKWYGTYDHKPDGSWDRTAERMLLNFAETEHPVFRCTSALVRGELRSKESGKKSIHFSGSTQKH